MTINKGFLKSKTMWAALITAIVPAIFPDAKELIAKHPDYVMGAVGFIFSILRITTTKPVVLLKKS